MRKSATPASLTAATIAALMLVAACSTKSSSSGTNPQPSSTGSSSASTGVSGQGVTADTIKVGITYPDLAAIRSVVNIDHGDYKAAYTAIINDINSRGGINGRKLVPVFAPVNPIGTAPADAACTKLTEDDKVFAVLGAATNPQCYITTHGVPIVGTNVSSSQATGAKAPWFNATLTTDHALTKLLDVLAKQGVFKGHKVGVVGQSEDQADVNNLALPELKKLGVPVAQTAINDAPTTDVNAGYQQYKLIANKFQAAGVDLVVAVGNASSGWPKGLQVNNSSYLPRLVAGYRDGLASYVADSSGNDPKVLQEAVTGNGQPSPTVSWNDPLMKSCVALVQAAEPNAKINSPITATAKTPNTWVSPSLSCQNVALFQDIVKAAGSTLNNSTFNRAGESLSSVVLPGFGGAALHYGPSNHDGDGPIYLSHYDAASKTLVIDSKPS